MQIHSRQRAALLTSSLLMLIGCSRELEVAPTASISSPTADVSEKQPSETKPEVSSRTEEATSISAPAIEPIVPHEFEVVGPEDTVQVAFADLNLRRLVPEAKSEKEAAEKVPQWIMALNGRRIRIRGFMLPTFMPEGLTAFALDRDRRVMNFGPNPPISDLIEVQLREGITTDYINQRPFDVVGVLKIGTEAVPGRFYQLSDAILIDDKKKPETRRSN